MINTAPPASNSVYGREKEKPFPYDKINLTNHVCRCGAVVKELLARADIQSSTPGNAVFCFFVPFFFYIWSLSFFILSADPAAHTLGSIYILSLSPEFYFEGISKALDLYTGQAYDQIKTISCQDIPPLKQQNFFSNVS